MWDLLFDMSIAFLNPRHANQDQLQDHLILQDQLRTFTIAILCLTRTLPCEPCRRNFTHATHMHILPRLQRLYAMAQPDETSDDAQDSQTKTFRDVVSMLREVQFDVIVRLSGQRGEKMMPIPSSDEARIRELMIMQRSVSSASRIVDSVNMMASQITHELSEANAWIRFASLYMFIKCAADMLAVVPGRNDLFNAFRNGLMAFDQDATSCLTYSATNSDLSLCVKTLAFYIRYNLICIDDVQVSRMDSVSYFEKIEQIRGSALSDDDDQTDESDSGSDERA